MLNIVFNNRCDKYRISKMTTSKSNWLHLHDVCVLVSCHQGDDIFS